MRTHSADEYIGGIGDIEDLFILLINAAMSFTNNKGKMFYEFPRDQDIQLCCIILTVALNAGRCAKISNIQQPDV